MPEHAAYSPDLAPLDYYVFSELVKSSSNDDVLETVNTESLFEWLRGFKDLQSKGVFRIINKNV